MAIDNSFILQQILQEQTKSNDNLSAMRELLADSLKLQQKNGKKKSGNDDEPPRSDKHGNLDSRRRPPQNQNSKLFKNLFGEMKNFSKTVVGNNATAANVTNSLGMSLGSVASSFKAIPGPVGAAATAFTMVVDAGMAVYNYMNEQLQMYNQLNSAGLTLRDGMLTVRGSASQSFMSLNEFTGALEKNSGALAAMDGQYGDGVEYFANLMGSVTDLQRVNGLYGVSQQQLADLAAKNFKYNKLYSSQNALNSINQQQSTADFVGQMTYLSKTVGKSVDELLGKFDSMGQTLDSTVSQFAMTDNWGVDADKAAEVTKSMNSVYASMGETGDILSKINASRLSLFSLPEEYNNNFMQSYADMMEQLQREGVTDTKEIRKRMHEFTVSRQDSLNEEIKAQQRSGNIQAASLLNQIKNQEKLFNDSNTTTNAQLEQYTNNFNIWITKTFTQPFNKLYADTQLSAMKWLSDMTQDADGVFDVMANIAKDAYLYITTNLSGMFGIIWDLPGQIGKMILGEEYDKVKNAYNDMMGDLVQVPARIASLVWDWLTGSDISESESKLKGTVQNVFAGFNDFWDKLSNIKFDYSDMKSRIQESFESMKKSISGWWDTAKGWFSNDPIPEEAKKTAQNNAPVTPINNTQGQETVVAQNKPQQPPVIAEPPNKKPVRISEEAKKKEQEVNNPVQAPLVDYDESMLAALKQIAGTLDAANSNNAQVTQLLRAISENTEATRQT